MRQYGLSKQKLLGILYKPERKEQGIVPGTTAVMKTNPTSPRLRQGFDGQARLRGASKEVSKWRPKRSPGEIWLMYKDVNPSADSGRLRRIISAWRYPGISKPGEAIPVPDDIRLELLSEKE